MAGTIRCSIVTPSEAFFDGTASYVSVPSWDGQVGIMAGRSPLLCRLGIGVLTLKTDGGEERILIDGGFAQMTGDELTILTERAERSDDLDVETVEGELQRANAEAVSGGLDRDDAEAAQARARARLQLVRG